MARKLITIEQMGYIFEQRAAGVKFAAIAFELGFSESHLSARYVEARDLGFNAFRSEMKRRRYTDSTNPQPNN